MFDKKWWQFEGKTSIYFVVSPSKAEFAFQHVNTIEVSIRETWFLGMNMNHK